MWKGDHNVCESLFAAFVSNIHLGEESPHVKNKIQSEREYAGHPVCMWCRCTGDNYTCIRNTLDLGRHENSTFSFIELSILTLTI